MHAPSFHPLVAKWFEHEFEAPTEVQLEGWEAIARGHNALISAPTGSGKTLAAFMWAINSLFERAAVAWEREEALADEIASGTPLGDAFELESFLSERDRDPEADFGAHLATLDRAI